ncbi:MAG: hypothetical protein AB7G75_02650 [Candidatus Binatia bacterium]
MNDVEPSKRHPQWHRGCLGWRPAYVLRERKVPDRDGDEQISPVVLVLPEQFHGHADAGYKLSGEVALMFAVLDDAISCYRKGTVAKSRRAQRLAREAGVWLFSDDPAWPFSFVNACGVLGLDSEYIRLGLRRWGIRSADALCQQSPKP